MQRQDTVRLGRIGIWLTGLLVVWLVAGLAAPAKADLRGLSYTSTLTFKVGALPGASGYGAGAAPAVTFGGHLSTLFVTTYAGGPINASVPVTSNLTINSVIFTGVGNIGATITRISGGSPLGSGAMGMVGMAKVCLVFSQCAFAHVPIPLSPTPGGGMGIGGTQTFPGAVAITMRHSPWTVGQPAMTLHSPGTSSYTTPLPGGFAHGPASPTSSTARPSGVLQLVTASKVFTSLTGAFPELAVTGVLRLHLVPEPGTLLLLGSGVAGLAVLGRRRRSG